MLVFLNSLRGKGRMFPAAEQGSSRCVCEIAARAGINLKNVLRSICNVFLVKSSKNVPRGTFFSLYFSRKGKCIDIFKAAAL